jgi:signal transduction histidine kinase
VPTPESASDAFSEEAILVRINHNYWSPLENGGCSVARAVNLQQLYSNFPVGQREIHGAKLAAVIPSATFRNERYLLLITDEFVAWRVSQPTSWLSKGPQPSLQLESFGHDAEGRVHKFHRTHLNQLRDKMNNPASGPTEIAAALRDYLFCEHYSVWFYSRFTKHFTLLCASFIPEQTFVSLDAPDVTLQGTLRSQDSYTEKTVEPGKIHSKPLNSMQTAIRCRVDLRRSERSGDSVVNADDQSVAIFSFYSPFREFYLFPSQKSDLSLGVRTVISAEQTIFTERSTLLLESVIESYQPGYLGTFLNNITKSITDKCGWEAASVFLIDDKKPPTRLELHASSVPPGTPSVDKKSYLLNRASKTVSVFSEKKLKYSYDILDDPENTHGIDELTVNPPKNWLAVPILHNAAVVGVLRAKNKIRSGVVIAFNDLDISLLRHFADVCGYVYGIETESEAERRRQTDLLAKEVIQLERETKLRKELEKTNEQLTDFITTFQHELRSPLTIFVRVRDRLERALRFHGLIQPNDPLPKRLRELSEDTEVLANRLAFITNSMELSPADIVQEHRRCECFRDIVAPILTFAVLYARNRNLDLRCNRQSLFLPVFCDPMAASLALHTLIDNAIKYADPGTVIGVEGIPRAGSCTIRISDIGLPVAVSEAEEIFKKHVRGTQAKLQKIGGAGIGLYLAREIMTRNNGHVALVSNASPVVFELVISSIAPKRGAT